MADQQRVIEFLRDVRQGVGAGGLQNVTEEISEMAAEYAVMCEQANERLRKCSVFLQQGLRTEAIHLAEEAPNLLDLVAQLDLPDPQAWVEFCQNNGLPVPPPLQMERAAQLNDAYAQDQPMEHLLARHRLLALSRAPVRDRLEVMRQISQIDAGNENWDRDIRLFEGVRLKELPAAFHTAMKNHDDAAIGALYTELNQEPWREAAPADLAAAVGEAWARIQRAGLEAALKKLVEPLRDAFAAQSLQECQALVQRWKNMMAGAGISSVSAELMDEIRPVVAYVNEQTKRDEFMRRFGDSCKVFSKMLDSDAPDAQLEAGYAKLKEFKEDIPEELTRRYMAKRAGRRQDADRRHKVRLMAIAGAFALLISVGLVVAYFVSHASNADRWARKISDATNQNTKSGLDEAQGDVDKLQADNPGMLKEPHVAAAVNELRARKDKYAADVLQVGLLANKLEAARQAAVPMVGKQDATMGEIRTAAAGLDAAINEAASAAKAMAWADGDHQLSGAVAGAQTVRSALRSRVSAAVTDELRTIETALGAIPQNPSTPDLAAQAQRELSGLADRVVELHRLPLLEGETLAAVDAMTDRLATLRQGANASGSVAAELENVRRAAKSAGELRAGLEAFVAKLPADGRSTEFNQALLALKPAETLEAWLKFLGTLKGYVPTNPQDAQRRLDAVSKFNADHPENPKGAEAARYENYLKRAVETMSDKGPWQTSLADLLATPMLTDLAVMEISDGRHIYTLGDIKRVDRRLNNQSSVTFQALDPRPDDKGNYVFTTRMTVNIEPPASVISGPNPAPHTKVVAEINDSLKTINEGNWDTYGIDLADKLVRQEGMDLVVRAALLQQILKTEQDVAGPFGVEDAYGKSIADLGRQNPAQLPWWDPGKITDGTRRSLRQIIEGVPPAAALKAKVAANRSAMFDSLGLDSATAGVLLRDDAGTWSVHSPMSPVNGFVVWAVVGKEGTGWSLVKVGVASGGKFSLDGAALRGVPQGSIVYITHS